MLSKKRFVRLESLVAYVQTESDGDEVFIKYNGEKIAPADGKFLKMTKEPMPLNISVPLDTTAQWVELELWEYDRFSANDSLGKFRLLVDQAGENFTAELVREKASEGKYVLNWSVVEKLI